MDPSEKEEIPMLSDDYIGKNEHLLKSGQWGMCNDLYCTKCPTYYNLTRHQKQSRTSELYDATFHNIGKENMFGSTFLHSWSHESSFKICSTVEQVLCDFLLVCSIYRSAILLSAVCAAEIEKIVKALRARREELQRMAKNKENRDPPPAVSIRNHIRPVINANYSGIVRGTINANNFELKPALINMVQQNQFGGALTSDLHLHLRTFLEIVNTVHINGVSEDTVRLRLFLFSLRDQARSWLQSLPLGNIITWTDMATKFLAKYFSLAKSVQMKIEISTFRQNDLEQLYEACERYKELLKRCPNHGFEIGKNAKKMKNEENKAVQLAHDR